MVVREKNCYYAIALTDFFVFLSCAEKIDIICSISAHDKKIKKSDKTRHNSNFFDELNHAKSYQT